MAFAVSVDAKPDLPLLTGAHVNLADHTCVRTVQALGDPQQHAKHFHHLLAGLAQHRKLRVALARERLLVVQRRGRDRRNFRVVKAQ